MMMPTWVGAASGRDSVTSRGADCGSAFAVPATNVTRSDLHHLGLLLPGDLLDAFDELIGQLLQPLLRTLFVFLRDATLSIFLGLAQVIERFTAAIAHGHAGLFGAL